MEVGDRVWAEYRSTHTASCTVTVVGKQVLENGDTAPSKVYTLGIGSVTPTEIRIPLFKSYKDGTTGFATVTTSVQNPAIVMAVVRR
jgi:hypothetical protein